MFKSKCIVHFTISIVILGFLCTPNEAFLYRLITETLQNNVAGEPITHERTEWDFNPDAAKQRRAIFYETNGFRASKFIERIGVGLDGNQDERREVQYERDIGKLNGEHNINFPPPPV